MLQSGKIVVRTREMPSSPWAHSITLSHWTPLHSMATHQHDEAVICLVVGGEYEERTRGRAGLHTAGHALFCPPHEEHAQRISRAGARKLTIRPTGEALDYLADRTRLSEAPFVQSAALSGLAQRFVGEFRQDDAFAQIALDGLVLECFASFGRALRDASSAIPPWLMQARDFIESSSEHFTLDEMARALSRHPAELAQAYKQAFHQSIAAHARESRIRRAAALLAKTRQPIVDIAIECGFHDQAHFSRAFKQVLGVTPARFRAEKYKI